MKRLQSLVLPFLLGSCLLLPPPRIQELYQRQGRPLKAEEYTLVLAGVSVIEAGEEERVADNTSRILDFLIKKHARNTSTPSSILYLSACLEEEAILRDYETLNSISVELRLCTEEGGEPETIALYSEETKNTLSSYRYLFRIVADTFGSLFP